MKEPDNEVDAEAIKGEATVMYVLPNAVLGKIKVEEDVRPES